MGSEAVRGRYMRKTREEELSAEDIVTIQERSWADTFSYAVSRSPFYREHFRQAGVRADRPPLLSELNVIPPVDKATLSEKNDSFLCVPRRKVIDIVTTSGTTGKPLVTMLTERDLQRLAYNEYLSFRCAGLSSSDTVLIAVTLDRCFIAGMAYFLGLRMLGCSVVRVGPAIPMMHLDMMRRLNPTAVVGVPSFLCLLADKAAEAGLNLVDCSVRRAVCIGEPVRREDFSPSHAGGQIEKRWNARVFSTYGVTELAISLCECEAGQGGHLHPELLFLEALDDQGRAVPDGHVGELVATTFGVEGMPLIRYRTGDCAAIFRTPCGCGRKTMRIGPILGRKSQKLKVKGTTLFPSTLKLVLDSIPGLEAYVIIARRETELSDSVEVRVACKGDQGAFVRALRERFQGEAKVVPGIMTATMAEIDTLQMPDGARKRRYFIDERSSQ